MLQFFQFYKTEGLRAHQQTLQFKLTANQIKRYSVMRIYIFATPRLNVALLMLLKAPDGL